jgi:hypothetical protein
MLISHADLGNSMFSAFWGTPCFRPAGFLAKPPNPGNTPAILAFTRRETEDTETPEMQQYVDILLNDTYYSQKSDFQEVSTHCGRSEDFRGHDPGALPPN